MTFPRIAPPAVAALISLFSALSIADAQDAFDPFSVFVVQDQSHTRCGPGEDFYRTDPLNHGQQLEVYAETKDGWLGVRPPEGSFCWLPEDAAATDPGGQTATVTEDKTVAWIGTQLGRASKYRWQVQLGRGETVSIIGRSEREGPDGPQTWLRIVPPSGEFRWIHRDNVVLTSEELVALTEDPGDGRDREFFPDGPTHIEPEKQKVSRPARVASFGKRSQPSNSESDPRVESRIRESGQSVLEAVESRRRQRSLRDEGRLRPDVATLRDGPASRIETTVRDRSMSMSDQAAARRDTIAREASEPLTPRSIGPASALPTTAEAAPAPVPKTGLLAFLTRPRIGEPGTGADAPATTSSNGGWFAKSSARIGPPRALASAAPLPQTRIPPNPFAGSPNVDDSRLMSHVGYDRNSGMKQTLSGAPALPAQSLTPISSLPLLRPTAAPEPRIVASETLERLRGEAASAGAAHLNLMLSRLMATEATSIEIQTVVAAADASLARGMEPGAMTTLRTRAQSMAEVASRREGVAPIVRQGLAGSANVASRTLPAPASLAPPTSSTYSASPNSLSPNSLSPNSLSPNSLASANLPAPTALGSSPSDISVAGGASAFAPATVNAVANGQPVEATVSGQLVKVYGPNPSAPPYAITDSAGRTLCYVTPIPGVNLTTHLNSVVSVRGLQGYLAGLSMPHLRADSVIRR